MRICNICKIRKSLDLFYKDRHKKDGRSYRCKACDNARDRNLPPKIRIYKPKKVYIRKTPAKPIRIIRGFYSYKPVYEVTSLFFKYLKKHCKIIDPDREIKPTMT